jgi:LuxR family transcriptional regulator, maltose regulon positive regulatory protein
MHGQRATAREGERVIGSPLLETKLFVPRPRRGLVARPRLIERLNRGSESKLTLISAPVGFGKSTLVAEWLAATPTGGPSAAWLSLDQADSQPRSFWNYLIAALQTVAPEVGSSALALLAGPQPPPIGTVLARLLNDLGTVQGDVVLVLDDYHLVDAREVDDGMTFLLERLPPRIHLVITTRADPALPLARLRGRGELVEIRAADLRFTPAEVAAYLNETMGLALPAPDIAALEGRTEGWIAALQLAALSIQGRDDVAGFIAGFSGDDRYVVDYLVEEVLLRQPESVRNFLLGTSILGLLTGPLCDAVTGLGDGKAMLEALDRKNLFLVPLDDRRRWYRYHHLFADVLRARLQDEQPGLVPELHRRAGAWCELNGDRSAAIHHAIAGADFDRAADLIELAIPATTQLRQEATLRGWLEALPDELLRLRPVLSNAYAGSLLVRGEVEGVEQRLRDAERWLGSIDEAVDGSAAAARPPAAGPLAGRAGSMAFADEAAFRQLPGSIAVHRAGQALILGDLAGTVAHARRALDLVREDDHVSRGGAAGLLALASWTTGDLEEAARWYAAGMTSLANAGHLSDVIGCGLALADIRLAQGRLGEALRILERGLALAVGQGGPVLRGAADMHVGISAILRERGDLEAAERHLQLAGDLGDENGLPQNCYRSRVARAAMRQAQGDLDGALELLIEAERLYVGDFSPDVRPVAAVKARVWVEQDRLTDVFDWARERGLSVDDELSYVREFEHITLARMLLAGRDRDDASMKRGLDLLERLLRAAEAGGRTGGVIEILILQALGRRARGDIRAALVPLERALALAEPEGYVRIFADEGAPMAALLEAAARQSIAPSYVRRLLVAMRPAEAHTTARQPLIEPLSERELDVLRLLAGDLDGPAIAAELVVSLNTVRSHTKSIYSKLDVNSRREAVRRTAELGLLSRASRGR